MNKKTIGVLGSTGSVGSNTINVINENNQNYQVKFLVAKSNYKLLAQQAILLNAEMVIIEDVNNHSLLAEILSTYNIEIRSGKEAVLEAATIKCDIVMAAMSGAEGLLPVIKAIEAGSNIALVNKECFVCAGAIINEYAKKHHVSIIPVDSEHSGVMQIINNDINQVRKITLTASGGPFLTKSYDEIKNATVADAIKHPTWSMGRKISIDSATLFNKGLEIIEAHYLFNLALENIEILVHPQSLVHSIVHYNNGSTIMQAAERDMRIPINIALNWPSKISTNYNSLNLIEYGKLEFFELDNKKFPAVNITKNAFKAGGNAAITMNAANEVAVENFLQNRIKFIQITEIVEAVLARHKIEKVSAIEDVLCFDKMARHNTQEYIKQIL